MNWHFTLIILLTALLFFLLGFFYCYKRYRCWRMEIPDDNQYLGNAKPPHTTDKRRVRCLACGLDFNLHEEHICKGL